MADSKLVDLTEATSIADTDLMYVSSGGVSKKVVGGKFDKVKLSNSGFTTTLQSGTLSGNVVHTLPTVTTNIVGDSIINTFTVAQRSNITTDNDLSFDLAVANKFKCTPTALGTLTFTNLAAQSGMVILDNTGGFAISLAASIKAKSGVATTLSTAGVYLIGYDCDGTNVYITVSAAMV